MVHFKELINLLKLHDGILRRGREPYINHCVRVALTLEQLDPNNHRLHLLGMLHDILEVNGGVDMEALVEGFKLQPTEVAVLECLTRKEGESSEEHFERCLESNHIYVLFIKYADNLDNWVFSPEDYKFTAEVLDLNPEDEVLKYLRRVNRIALRVNKLCKKEVLKGIML